MVEVIIRPDVGKALIRREMVFSVHREDAALECNCPQRRGTGCGGISLDDIPLAFRTFELLCREKGKAAISRQAVRGYEWAGGELMLHGPWPSKTQNLQDAASPFWFGLGRRDVKDDLEHPEKFLSAVGDTTQFTHMDYVLVADFLIRDEFTDLEMPS